MSRVSVRTSAPGVQDMSARIADLANVTRRTMSAAMDVSKPLLHAYMDMLRTAVPAAGLRRVDRCGIPETECPPYCVCQIDWEGTRGGQLHATIRLTNTGKEGRHFAFEAGPFQGSSGDTGVVPSLSPSVLTLHPNESGVVNVSVEVGEQFQPGGDYGTEVKIRGLYEQCVRLRLRVRPEQKPHCEVQQGEIPRRIRAHHWYDHFQCEELCFEPIRRQPKSGEPADTVDD